MPKEIMFLMLVAIAVMGLGLSRDNQVNESASKNSVHQFKKIHVTVPVSVSEPARDALINKLTAMEEDRFVYLDLQINFKNQSGDRIPYSRTINGKPVEGASKGCEIGPLLMGAGVVYELGPISNYNHLLMSVFTGDRAAFPFNDISCDYRAENDQTSFRVRGFFHVIANVIPTAVALQLRPINPPLDVARGTLIR